MATSLPQHRWIASHTGKTTHHRWITGDDQSTRDCSSPLLLGVMLWTLLTVSTDYNDKFIICTLYIYVYIYIHIIFSYFLQVAGICFVPDYYV